MVRWISSASRRGFLLLVLAWLGAASVPSCIAVAAGGAGAATAAYLTSRGAKAVVNIPIEEASSNAQAVLSQRNISVSGEKDEKSGAHREFRGTTTDGKEVTVTLDRNGNNAQLTDLEVTVRKNTVEWDKDLARQIASEIAGRSPKG